jgi:hypothetical protein
VQAFRPAVESGGDRRRPDLIEHRQQRIHLRRREESVGTSRRDIGERRFVEERRADDTVLRQVIDDQVDELDLIRGERRDRPV